MTQILKKINPVKQTIKNKIPRLRCIHRDRLMSPYSSISVPQQCHCIVLHGVHSVRKPTKIRRPVFTSQIHREQCFLLWACEDLRGSFTPLVCSCDGVLHREFHTLLKRTAKEASDVLHHGGIYMKFQCKSLIGDEYRVLLWISGGYILTINQALTNMSFPYLGPRSHGHPHSNSQQSD
ncbi:unnamed protein product, partial [Nesidiocoris tenuis]